MHKVFFAYGRAVPPGSILHATMTRCVEYQQFGSQYNRAAQENVTIGNLQNLQAARHFQNAAHECHAQMAFRLERILDVD